MNKIITGVIGVLALLGVILGAVALVGNQPAPAPAPLGSSGTRFPNGITVGNGVAGGTTLAALNMGTCNLYQYVNTIAATSSITTDCVNTSSAGFGTTGGLVALNGVQSGDKVFATLATSTSVASALGRLTVMSAIASTTNGYITVVLSNLSGTTYTFQPTTASTSLYYITVR